MFFTEEESVITTNLFADKQEALNYWNEYGGYFLILTDDVDETVYIIEDFDSDHDEYQDLEENITQVIKHRSDDVFPYVSQVIYEQDFLERVESYAV